ncbi:hypothetical protein ACKVMT_05765 [Halobacteriales archaeon Cl-PHB]
MSRERCPSEDGRELLTNDDAVFCAVVEEYEDRADQCTIYPRGCSGVDRMSTWISAREGSFLALEDAR